MGGATVYEPVSKRKVSICRGAGRDVIFFGGSVVVIRMMVNALKDEIKL